jgi:hypothetical protein
MGSLNPKQQVIVDWAKAQLEFFETSNDINSQTHFNDMDQSLEIVAEEHDIRNTFFVHKWFERFYISLKNLQ